MGSFPPRPETVAGSVLSVDCCDELLREPSLVSEPVLLTFCGHGGHDLRPGVVGDHHVHPPGAADAGEHLLEPLLQLRRRKLPLRGGRLLPLRGGRLALSGPAEQVQRHDSSATPPYTASSTRRSARMRMSSRRQRAFPSAGRAAAPASASRFIPVLSGPAAKAGAPSFQNLYAPCVKICP